MHAVSRAVCHTHQTLVGERTAVRCDVSDDAQVEAMTVDGGMTVP